LPLIALVPSLTREQYSRKKGNLAGEYIKPFKTPLHWRLKNKEGNYVIKRCYDVDTQPLVPGEPAELVFDLYPTSYIFHRGNRIRVTITCSLQSMYSGMIDDPPPQINIYREAGHLSYIELPLIPEVKQG
jgi:hypothetical protein